MKEKFIFPALTIFMSVALTYLVIELVLFRLFFHYLPLKLYGYVPEEISILFQSSKTFALPDNYIALAGDSHAQGKGDWLLNSNTNLKPGFQSAHVINEIYQRDVVTFGRGGAGSLDGIVRRPISHYEYINKSFLYSLPEPDAVLVYFYEGNDFNNNLRDIRQLAGHFGNRENLFNEKLFRRTISEVFLRKGSAYKATQRFSFGDNFFFMRFLSNLISAQKLDKDMITQTDGKWKAGEWNEILVNSEKVMLPDRLQAPPVGLDDNEIDVAVYVFEQSLLYLRSYFRNSRIGVMYVPSPLSSYEVTSQQVYLQNYSGKQAIYTTKEVEAASNHLGALIGSVVEDHGMYFVDARIHVRARSEKRILHGPIDWKHFNKDGQLALADAALDLLSKMETGKLVQ